MNDVCAPECTESLRHAAYCQLSSLLYLECGTAKRKRFAASYKIENIK